MNQSHPEQNLSVEQKLQLLEQQYAELETKYLYCQAELKSAREKADRQEEHRHFIQQNYDLMVTSGGHRLLEKYYAFRRLLLPSTWRNALLARIEPIQKKLRHWKNKRHHTLTRDDMYLIISQSRRMDVLADSAHSDTAKLIQSILTDAGLECNVHLSQQRKYDKIPYIVIAPHALTQLPEIYAVFYDGTELTDASRSVLQKAYAVFLSSTDAIGTLDKEGSDLLSKIYYMPFESHTTAEYHLLRFLLAVDLVTFDAFYDKVSRHVSLHSNRICLSLPETPERRASFERDNRYGFECFPGLKHHLGWIGCGMSYKFIFKKALEQHKESILVCEDDVYFPSDFDARFSHVLDYIQTHKDWSIFSGIMADMGTVSVLECDFNQSEHFVVLDKMISMVFNIYNPQMFSLIAQWDSNNRNKQTNTIDRYLEDKCHRVLTTCPFLVGHKEDLNSTIWNHKNDLYNAGIENSSKKLHLLVDDFLYQMKLNQN